VERGEEQGQLRGGIGMCSTSASLVGVGGSG